MDFKANVTVPLRVRDRDIADPETDVEDSALTAVEVAWLRGLLLRLPRHERLLLALSYGLNGSPTLSVRQLAPRLGCGKSTVQRRLQDALEHLRQLAGLEDEAGAAAIAPSSESIDPRALALVGAPSSNGTRTGQRQLAQHRRSPPAPAVRPAPPGSAAALERRAA